MAPRYVRSFRRVLIGAGVAIVAMVLHATAKDLPGTPEGASRISAFIETYAGKAAATPPALVIRPEASGYTIMIDIGALTAPLKAAGIVYDPAIITLMAFEQDDGTWRLEQTDLPKLSGQRVLGDARFDFLYAAIGHKSAAVIDPALSWVRNLEIAADRIGFALHGPGVNETLEAAPVKVDATSKAAPDGALSTAAKETFGSFSIAISADPKALRPDADASAEHFDFAAQSQATSADLSLDDVKPRALLDLWAFWVAHPTRPELAANEAAFKTLINAAITGHPSFAEDLGMNKLNVRTPKGSVAFDDLKFGFGGALAGPDSQFNEHVAASGLSLPPGVVPDMYRDFVPTSFDVAFKVGGIDLTAAAAEAVANLHLAGDQPPISKEDKDKVIAKLVGDGPVVIDIAPSRVQGAAIDLALEGQVRYLVGRPTGTITVHMRNFDKTASALRGLSADAQAKMTPVIAMAKGLAKTEDDGALTWVGEIAADGMMKINGLPIGKAPFAAGAK